MLRYVTAATIFAMALPMASSPVIAQERFGDAALGALSGAVVLGPVGAVAGALVGYTAGPGIAHSWGLHSSGHRPPHAAKTAAHAAKANAAPLPKPRPTSAPPSAPSTAPSVTSSPPMKSAGASDTPPPQSYE